ncbi:hypothetical protein GCM10010174_34770 [Kutzneria viridogrisea]|uniref:Uncharacterized protein n=2 Tax=Kutzneria TaxID=43356 RepID=A0ABR6BLA1_9PSEU|nr:hypothetical protein [Kutzneria albida]AHH94958.1 putative membrane protein [Kutzneria albida DSM 43870]MBA8927687.1 hypothetical protein [Kutzneria viridogrisea]
MDELDDHPDLNDPKWLREAERRANAEIRRYRRKQRGRPKLGTIVLVVAALAFAAACYGLYQLGGRAVSNPVLPEATRDALPTQGVDLTQPFAGSPAGTWAEHGRSSYDLVSGVHEEVDYSLVEGRRVPGESKQYFLWMACDAAKRGELAPYFANPVESRGAPLDNPDSAFAPSAKMDAHGTCPG